jgi:predicted amidohydrolase
MTSTPCPVATSTFSVAVLTADPVEFALAKSTAKAVALIKKAAFKGAKMAAFGELWLPV